MQDNTQKKAALTIGISLVIMTIAAGIAVGNFQTQLWIKGDALATKEAWSSTLFMGILINWSIIVLTDALVSWAICIYYQKSNKILARISSFSRWLYTILLFYAVFQLSSPYLANPELPLEISIWENFEQNWHFALIIFGIHLFFWGILAWKDLKSPNWLNATLIFAGIAYFLISILKYYFPDYEQLTETLETILMAPMIIGELGMGIWLLVWGWRK